jgi:hypothetical protein
VKLIERRGAEVLVTRDCLSSLESFRIDVPAGRGTFNRTCGTLILVFVVFAVPVAVRYRFMSNQSEAASVLCKGTVKRP